ncbi:hypothetical protein FDP41_007524 [Naegleria fowleri]|uniref:Uncharacterized protein n=1 Tax=Naegleria fowleri TaxID=5763 RepID=A0A6A5C4X0_NAEFO|nr:uncharacterized protein FDP41_007524 [Naegleria fowleri]KAF0984347.1 hypothetical protein FDP41_007524 [Naegleria fowleri]
MSSSYNDPEAWRISVKFGKYYLINLEKSCFSEMLDISPQLFNQVMQKKTKNMKLEQLVKKSHSQKDPGSKDKDDDGDFEKISPLKSITKKIDTNDYNEQKVKDKKAPSDSFFTCINETSINILKEKLFNPLIIRDTRVEKEVEYHCYIIGESKDQEFKVKLDSNFRRISRVVSSSTRFFAGTFISSVPHHSDMRLYFNMKTLVEENSNKIVNLFNDKEQIIKPCNDNKNLEYNPKLRVNLVRKLMKERFDIKYYNQVFEVSLLKVETFIQSGLGYSLGFLESHYEMKIAIPHQRPLDYDIQTCRLLCLLGIDCLSIMNA